MEAAVQKFTILSLFIVGLSHVLQPRPWAELFLILRGKGAAGVFMVALLHLPIGLTIVSFHNVWIGVPMVVTILGWCWTVKGFLYLCFPRVGQWGLARVSIERAHEFQIPGVVFVLLSLWLGYSLWR